MLLGAGGVCGRVSSHGQGFGDGDQNGGLQAEAYGNEDRGASSISDADSGTREKRSCRSQLFQTGVCGYEQESGETGAVAATSSSFLQRQQQHEQLLSGALWTAGQAHHAGGHQSAGASAGACEEM